MDNLSNKIICGDTLTELKKLPDESVDTIVSSPPYWGLRDYGVAGQLGLEPTLEEFITKLLLITAELKRVLKKTGVMFWNHGDCYGGIKQGKTDKKVADYVKDSQKNLKKYAPAYEKCMMLQNYRLILQMIDQQGWILRNTIIWHKPNHMPSSVKDRFANAYEPVFMLTKSKKYWFDLDAVRIEHKEPWRSGTQEKNDFAYGEQRNSKEFLREYNPAGKNPGDLWTIPTQPFPQAHFATFPEKLIEPMVMAGCPEWICKKCGKARERIIENPTIKDRNITKEDEVKYAKEKGSPGSASRLVSSLSKHLPEEKIYQGKTIGWTDCSCKADWHSGIVLDPFGGAMTTCVVAKKLRRDYLAIELNPEYITIGQKRLDRTIRPML